MKKFILPLTLLFFSFSALPYGSGLTMYPLKTGDNVLTGEAVWIFHNGSGAGLQGRFTHKFDEDWTADFGTGFGSGERAYRFFAGADYRLFPDVKSQPRISFKGTFEIADEYDDTRVIVGISPVVSKGFTFSSGQKIYPFLSLPMEVNTGSNHTDFGTRLGMGVHVPVMRGNHSNQLIASGEMNFNLNDSYSALILGLSFRF